jgi:hypothetical protein
MRADCLGLWVAEDGKALFLEEAEARYLATITPGLAAPCYPPFQTMAPTAPTYRLPAAWVPAGRTRLPYVEIETGEPGRGRTYRLYLAAENTDPSAHGGYQWRPPAPEDPIDALRAFPEIGLGLIDAVALYPGFDEDYGNVPWAEPLAAYRKATAAEAAIYGPVEYKGRQ